MKLSLIAAMADSNRVIGDQNRLPWRISKDLKYFKETTLGCPIIMGRKTFESIGKALPGRRNIVLSRQVSLLIPGVEVFHTLTDALIHLKDENDVFVIGGADVYKQALPNADRIYLTQIYRETQGDAFFPVFNEREFKEVSRRSDSEGETDFDFVIFERVANLRA